MEEIQIIQRNEKRSAETNVQGHHHNEAQNGSKRSKFSISTTIKKQQNFEITILITTSSNDYRLPFSTRRIRLSETLANTCTH